MCTDPNDNDLVPTNSEEVIDSYINEYNTLESTIDELNAFMDVLEQRSDSLRQRIAEHLEETRNNRPQYLPDDTDTLESRLANPEFSESRIAIPDSSESKLINQDPSDYPWIDSNLSKCILADLNSNGQSNDR